MSAIIFTVLIIQAYVVAAIAESQTQATTQTCGELLNNTQFVTALDSWLYIVEWISPGFNAGLANTTHTSRLFWIRGYAIMHTTEAHEKDMPYSYICFMMPLPKTFLFTIFTLLFLLLFIVQLALFVYAALHILVVTIKVI